MRRPGSGIKPKPFNCCWIYWLPCSIGSSAAVERPPIPRPAAGTTPRKDCTLRTEGVLIADPPKRLKNAGT